MATGWDGMGRLRTRGVAIAWQWDGGRRERTARDETERRWPRLATARGRAEVQIAGAICALEHAVFWALDVSIAA